MEIEREMDTKAWGMSSWSGMGHGSECGIQVWLEAGKCQKLHTHTHARALMQAKELMSASILKG
eukprot:1152625-Pelagomonas_calceolata.AAC.3